MTLWFVRCRAALVAAALLAVALAGGSARAAAIPVPTYVLAEALGSAGPAPNADVASPGVQPLRGLVLGWDGDRLVRVAGAFIGTGNESLVTDARGRFLLPAARRTGAVSVVKAGFQVVRRAETGNYFVAFLRPLDVRAIYVPYDQLRHPSVLRMVEDLAAEGAISGVVVDVKEEGGAVLPIVADDLAREIGAAIPPGDSDVAAWLERLGQRGVYRIARIVTFLDSWLAFSRPTEAILNYEGHVLEDSIGLAWTSPFSEVARQHNVDVGVNAARYFEEVQYDYVRLPGDAGVAVRGNTTGAERSAVIAQFAAEAAAALHAAGAAVAIDTFGQTTVIYHDDGIGQILEDLAPYLDYYSPMVYPSTWTAGWFGLAYPAAEPGAVVRQSVALAVERTAAFPNIVVRPWLQDFHDYGERKVFYGWEKVLAQIEASAEAGGQGFMLWDPSLAYHTDVLRLVMPGVALAQAAARDAAAAEAGASLQP